MHPWRWDQLRRMGEAKAANLITFMPFVAFALSHSDRLREVIPSISAADLGPIYVLFLGLLALSIGNLLYSAYVPYQVARYKDDVEYYLSEKDAWWQNEHEEILRLLPPAQRAEVESSGLLDRIKLVRTHYRKLTEESTLIRWMVSSLYVLGFILVSVPTTLNAIKTIGLLLDSRWPLLG